ncbi:MAG TPA: SMC-Scp complex subunit ScpB [Anaerolineales bacterium]|nr:SMC-Scp complex subunit ScpB [Anaerolineales bacterium]
MSNSGLNQDGSTSELASIEAILFIAIEPVSINHLATILETSVSQVEEHLNVLEDGYKERGIRLLRTGGKVLLTSAPEKSQIIEKFLGLEATSRLSRAALESLAIIAYKQPVTRPDIDAIRGVNSDGVLRSLISKDLILELGRSSGPGRPILYGTTSEFLQYFGLPSLSNLPPLDLSEEESEMQLLKE